MKFSLDINRNMQKNIRHDFCINLITRHVPIVLTTKRFGMEICDVITQVIFQQHSAINLNLIAYWLVLFLLKYFVMLHISLLCLCVGGELVILLYFSGVRNSGKQLLYWILLTVSKYRQKIYHYTGETVK